MECKLDTLTVYYEVVGEGRPVVMLHGAYLDHRYMMLCMEPFFAERPGWKRIYLDAPGHGQTGAPEWLGHHDQVLDVILQAIDVVIPGQRFVLAGMSWGGYLARGVVYRRAASIDGLLLIGPSVYRPVRETPPPHTVLVQDAAALAELKPDEKDDVFEQVAVIQSQAILAHLRASVYPAQKLADEGFWERVRNNGNNFSFDVDALPAPFTPPTLFLLGRQDSMVGYRDAWSILENYPHATFAILDRAGHFLAGTEQTALCRGLMHEWLDRVIASGPSHMLNRPL